MYLNEIGRVPLLTGAEEVEFSRRIETGGFAAAKLADIAASGGMAGLEFSERRELQRSIRRGEDAREVLIEAKLRLVVRSEEHTSELKSLMRTSYAVFCLKKKSR